MSSTVFVNGVTLTDDDWFNDVNRLHYTIFGDPADLPAVKRAVNPTLAAEQASTSGTAIDFTGIPSGTKRITVMFVGVSTNGTSGIIIQLGDAGGFEGSGYLGSGSQINSGSGTDTNLYTTGFGSSPHGGALGVVHGAVTLSLQKASSFQWVAHGVLGYSDGASNGVIGGSKALSAELDRVRITNVNGTDAFDAGAISITYE